MTRRHDPPRSVDRAELAALERRVLGKRRRLWVGVAAMLVPLAVLLGLQYRWLAELESSSTAARRASLEKRLEVVTKEGHWYYASIAERSLNLPAAIVTGDAIQKAAYHFKKKEIAGARELFVVSYPLGGSIWFYDPSGPRMFQPAFSDEFLAVWSATAPWQVLAKKGIPLETVELDVHQRDPANRIILNPITDEASRVVGLAGMILDVMLPRMTGLELCRTLRGEGSELPIIMLTARGQEIDKVLGLKLGADDYVTKPFSFMELLARAEALLRRSGAKAGNGARDIATIGELTVDLRHLEARRGGDEVEMSPREFELLRHFVSHRGEVVTREQLLEAVWEYDEIPFTRTVDTHIAKLRKKIEPEPANPRHLVTIHRRGYKLLG